MTPRRSSVRLKKPEGVEPESRPLVSLFCGCGGLDLGFREAGFQPVVAIDKDAMACRTYELNHPRRPGVEAGPVAVAKGIHP